MQFPNIKSNNNSTVITYSFNGINRRDKAPDGTFSSVKNLSSERFPSIAPRKPRKEILSMKGIQAVIAPAYANTSLTTFTGVAGGKFYYMGSEIPFEKDSMKIEINKNVCLVDFNGTIVITPDMYCYSYLPDPVTGKIDTHVRDMEQGFYEQSIKLYSSGDPTKDNEVKNYITGNATAIPWADHFKEGDSIFISGLKGDLEINNTAELDSRWKVVDEKRPISVVVEKVDGDELYFQMRNKTGARLTIQKNNKNVSNEAAKEVNIYIPIPKLNWVCVHNNRLWGTSENGEQIYASKVGDIFNFNTFLGLSTDSWYAQIGTPGEFVGLISNRDNIIAFKRNFIHHVYGDRPANFNVPKQIADCGCIDIKSAVEIGGAVYFLGYDGFYSYSGGSMKIISDNLNARYKSACGMSDGRKYFVYATKEDGTSEFLVYDIERNLWYQEDEIKAVGGIKWNNKLYVATNDKVIGLDMGEETINWECELSPITENIIDTKGINTLFLRIDLSDDGVANIYTRTDDLPYTLCRTITGRGCRTHCVPVRFVKGDSYQIKIQGSGQAVIHDIERTVYGGGKHYR